MSEYPEALVERVASAILDNFNPPDDTHSSWWINTEVSARAVLDSLGLREQRGPYRPYTRRRYVTKWEPFSE